MSAEAKPRPENLVEEIREGNVTISIWRNEGPSGPYCSASRPQNAYKDEQGKWHNDVNNYSAFDAKCLALAALRVEKKLRELSREAKQAEAA